MQPFEDSSMIDNSDYSHNDSSQVGKAPLRRQMSRRASKMQTTFEGWAMLPTVFNIWDQSGDGTLDKFEIKAGLALYCSKKNLNVSSSEEVIMKIFDEVDEDGNEELDKMEFSVFFSRFADEMDTCIYELAFFMVEELGKGGKDLFADTVNKLKLKPPKRSSIFNLLQQRKASTEENKETVESTAAVQHQREQIQRINELEYKLKQREDAISQLEMMLEVKNLTIESLTVQLDDMRSDDVQTEDTSSLASASSNLEVFKIPTPQVEIVKLSTPIKIVTPKSKSPDRRTGGGSPSSRRTSNISSRKGGSDSRRSCSRSQQSESPEGCVQAPLGSIIAKSGSSSPKAEQETWASIRASFTASVNEPLNPFTSSVSIARSG